MFKKSIIFLYEIRVLRNFFKINRTKTNYMICDFNDDIQIAETLMRNEAQEISQSESFQCLWLDNL